MVVVEVVVQDFVVIKVLPLENGVDHQDREQDVVCGEHQEPVDRHVQVELQPVGLVQVPEEPPLPALGRVDVGQVGHGVAEELGDVPADGGRDRDGDKEGGEDELQQEVQRLERGGLVLPLDPAVPLLTQCLLAVHVADKLFVIVLDCQPQAGVPHRVRVPEVL